MAYKDIEVGKSKGIELGWVPLSPCCSWTTLSRSQWYWSSGRRLEILVHSTVHSISHLFQISQKLPPAWGHCSRSQHWQACWFCTGETGRWFAVSWSVTRVGAKTQPPWNWWWSCCCTWLWRLAVLSQQTCAKFLTLHRVGAKTATAKIKWFPPQLNCHFYPRRSCCLWI